MMFRHSLYQVTFIQAAVIFETGPGSSRHMAVRVLGPAGRNFKYHYSSKITRITLFMVVRHSIYQVIF